MPRKQERDQHDGGNCRQDVKRRPIPFPNLTLVIFPLLASSVFPILISVWPMLVV